MTVRETFNWLWRHNRAELLSPLVICAGLAAIFIAGVMFS